MFNLRQVATYNIYLKDIIKELKEQKNELENYNNKLENILKLKLFPVITDIKEEYNKITKSNIPLKDYMKIYTHIENDSKIFFSLKESNDLKEISNNYNDVDKIDKSL